MKALAARMRRSEVEVRPMAPRQKHREGHRDRRSKPHAPGIALRQARPQASEDQAEQEDDEEHAGRDDHQEHDEDGADPGADSRHPLDVAAAAQGQGPRDEEQSQADRETRQGEQQTIAAAQPDSTLLEVVDLQAGCRKQGPAQDVEQHAQDEQQHGQPPGDDRLAQVRAGGDDGQSKEDGRKDPAEHRTWEKRPGHCVSCLAEDRRQNRLRRQAGQIPPVVQTQPFGAGFA
jgi:hypothetical protein